MKPSELRKARLSILMGCHTALRDDFNLRHYTEALDRLEVLDAQDRTGDLLQQVLESSAELVTRFGGTLTERGSFAKFNEESDEFKVAVRDLRAALNDDDPEYGTPASMLRQIKQETAQELIDVLVTAGGMAAFAGLTWDDIREQVTTVLHKNAAKTPETHLWDEATKTVRRRA